jgi:hypothetical protein
VQPLHLTELHSLLHIYLHTCPCYNASSRLLHLAKTILFQNFTATFYSHSPLESFLWVFRQPQPSAVSAKI